jgi:hypothetical protein
MRCEMRETLSFQELQQWFHATVSRSVSVQVTSGSETVAFLDGAIDNVMRFENADSHGLLIDGAAGAWTLQLAESEFVSATLASIPDSSIHRQLVIKMRGYGVAIEAGPHPAPEE